MVSYLTNIRTGLFAPPGPFATYSSQLVLEATAPFSYQACISGHKMHLLLSEVIFNLPLGTINVYDGHIETIEVSWTRDSTPQITIACAEEIHPVLQAMAGQPYRLIIYLDRSPLAQYFTNHSILIDPVWDGTNKILSPTNLPERVATLDIARRLAELLSQISAPVMLTRTDDSFIPVPRRLQLAQELHATIFLSIATGVNKKNPRSGFALKYYYGNSSGAALAAVLNQELGRKISIPSHGIKPVNMTLLRENHAKAAAWIETACISHRLDEGLLRDIDFKQHVAQGIFNGLKRFCKHSCNYMS
ncbi:MAG: N-acetylmuramoyl-L-alanine amidase family protein [bacterium]